MERYLTPTEQTALLNAARLTHTPTAQRDYHLMAALILSLVNGVVRAAAVDPDGPDHRAVAAQFLTLLLAAGGLSGSAAGGAT